MGKLLQPDSPKLRRGRSRQAGAAGIEFILSFMTIMFVLFWMWEMTMAVFTYNVLADAAKEGVRYAVVRASSADCSGASCVDGGGVESKVREFAGVSLHDTSAMTVNVQYMDNSGGTVSIVGVNTRVRVALSYNYLPYISLPWVAPQFNTVAEGRIVH